MTAIWPGIRPAIRAAIASGIQSQQAAGAAGFVLDNLPAAGAAYSLRRLLTAAPNKAINVRRLSDSAAQDVGFDASGNLDVAGLAIFLSATSGVIVTWYDQTGNGNHAVQATPANQPAYLATSAQFPARPSISFGDASAKALAAPASGTIDGLFGTAGFISAVTAYLGSATAVDRLFSKGSAIWELRNDNVADNHAAFIRAATTGGIWITANVQDTLLAHLYTLAYSETALSNDPTFAIDGAAQTYATDTNPTGTLTSDTGPLTLGNHQTLARGWPGNIAEILFFKTTVPSAGQKATLATDQKAYWGTP